MRSSVSPPTWIHFPLLILPVCLLISGATLAEAQSVDSEINSYLQYTDGLKTMWHESLKSLYQLSQNFILTITGSGVLQTVLREFGINISDPSTFTTAKFSLSDGGKFAQTVAKDAVGYIVIIIIGLILIVFFSLSACCMCCCRKLGCCCGKVADNDPKSSDVPVTIVLFVVVVSVSALLFLSAYGSIVSGVTAVDSLKDDKESGFPLLGNILPVAREIPIFLNRTLEEVSLMFNVSELMIYFENVTDGLSLFVQNELLTFGNDCRSCGELITDFQLLTSYKKNLSQVLENVNETQTSLDLKYHSFNETLEQFNDKTQFAVINCNNESCNALKKENLTRRELPFTNFSSITTLLGSLDAFDNSFSQLLPNITSQINNLSRSLLENLRSQLDNFIGNIRNNDFFQFDKKYLNRNSTIFANFDWNQVDKISSIAKTVLKVLAIAIGSIFFVVILLNVIGLILGPTCIKKNPKASQKVFLASSQISFMVGVPFCILAVILFILGTSAYREMCYDVRKEGDSEYFKAADKFIQLKIKELNLSSIKISGNTSIKFNFDNVSLITQTILNDCKNNGTLTKLVFDVIVFDNSTLDGLLSQFDSQLSSFNLSQLPIFSDEFSSALRNTSSQINNLMTTTFVGPNKAMVLQIQANFVERLNNITLLMNETLSITGSGANETVLMELMNVDAPKINETSRDIALEEEMLIDQLDEAKGMLINISSLLLRMANASSNAKTELANVTSNNFIKALKDKLKSIFKDLFDHLKSKFLEVGHCREAYELFNSIFYFFCDLVLNPMNAYWFSLGISIALLIPSFLSGLWLGGLFGRRHKTFDDYEGSEDDDAEFIDPKNGNYMNAVNKAGQTNLQGGASQPSMAAGGGAGNAVLPGTAALPGIAASNNSPASASPRNTSSDDLENASLYYIPQFPNSQPNNYASQDPYYNMPNFRMPQAYSGRPYSRLDVRIPRPWRPPSSGFSPYSRF